MPTMISTAPAKKHISTLEALRLLDALVRESGIGQAYASDTYSDVVADVIARAERQEARQGVKSHHDRVSTHLAAALDAMKASDPRIASFIEDIEETLSPIRR